MSPVKTVSLAGERTWNAFGGVCCTCPGCGSPYLRLLEDGFMCLGTGACTFSRGSQEDYLAAVLPGGYPEACARLASVGYATEDPERLALKRKLLDLLIRVEMTWKNTCTEKLLMLNQIERMGGSRDGISRMIYPFASDELDEFLSYCLELGYRVPKIPVAPRIAMVFWANRHTPSGTEFWVSATKGAVWMPMEPHRFGWLGLPKMHPDMQHLDVFDCCFEACGRAAATREVTGYRMPTVLYINFDCNHANPAPGKLRFVSRHDRWASLLPPWSDAPRDESTRFATLSDDGTVIADTDFTGVLLQEMNRMRHYGLGNQIPSYVSGLVVSLEEKDAAVKHLLDSGDYKLAHHLREKLSRRRIEAVGRGYLMETLEGYELETNEARIPLSNFHIRFTQRVLFNISKEVFVRGVFSVQGQEFDFELPARKLRSARLASEALTTSMFAEGRRLNVPAPVFLPGKTQVLLDWMERKALAAESVPGSDYLGWTHDRSAYSTPAALVTLDGIREGNYFCPADQHSGLHAFRSQASLVTDVPDELFDKLPPDLAELIAIMAGVVMRGYLNRFLRPVALRDNAETRVAATALVEALGQKELFCPPPNLQRAFDDLVGMPCLLHNINRLQASKAPAGGFYFDEGRGAAVAAHEEHILVTAGMCAAAAVHRTALQMLSKDLSGTAPVPSASWRTRLAAEGASVLRVCGLPWPDPVPEMPATDKTFALASPNLSSVFSHNRNEFFIDLEKVDNRDRLIEEWSLVSDRCLVDGNKLAADYPSAACLLQEYFGRVPVL